MKRILTVLLALLLLCLSATGCSSAKGKTLLTLEKDGKKAVLSVNLYELMLSRVKGRFVVNGETNGGYAPTDDAFWNVLDDYGDGNGKQTLGDYYSGLVLDNCRIYVAAEWLFESEGLALPGSVIDEVDGQLQDLINAYGSKTKLNAVLSDYGVNYAMLREAYLLEEKMTALQEHFYGKDASLVGSNLKDSYLAEHYVHFQQIVLPLCRYVYETDANGDAIWYRKESNLSRIAYDYTNGCTRQNEDGTPMTDANGDEIAYKSTDSDRICYDTENGIRSYKMKDGVSETEPMTSEEKEAVRKKAQDLFSALTDADHAAFEASMAEVNEYPTGTNRNPDGFYLNVDIDYASAGDSFAYLSEIIGKLTDAEVGTTILVEAEDGIHIIRKYEPTSGAYDMAENESSFLQFNSALTESLLIEKCRELFDSITVDEKILASATDIRRIGANQYLY